MKKNILFLRLLDLIKRMQKKKVAICVCASRSYIDKKKAGGLAAILKKENYHVDIEADLCKKVMNKSADMGDIASGIIMACHSRAIHSHLHWLGLTAEQVINIRNNSLDDILSQLQITHNANLSDKESFIEQINNLAFVIKIVVFAFSICLVSDNNFIFKSFIFLLMLNWYCL